MTAINYHRPWLKSSLIVIGFVAVVAILGWRIATLDRQPPRKATDWILAACIVDDNRYYSLIDHDRNFIFLRDFHSSPTKFLSLEELADFLTTEPLPFFIRVCDTTPWNDETLLTVSIDEVRAINSFLKSRGRLDIELIEDKLGKHPIH